MKDHEAMIKDPKVWTEAVLKEHERMEKCGVFLPIKDAKILTSTWSMKLKADETKRARLNVRGYEQIAGLHYNKAGVSSPVVDEASIFILFTLMVMTRMYGALNDEKGAFLNGDCTHDEKLYMEIPEGFEWFYPTGVLLLLLKTIYGLKQSAFEYWRVLLKAMRGLGLLRSKADPCVYYKWTDNGLCLWTSWVDDLLSIGKEVDVHKEKN